MTETTATMEAPPLQPWFRDLLGLKEACVTGQWIVANGVRLRMAGGILRAESQASEAQRQTETVFGYKWHQRHIFEGPAMRAAMREWLNQRYGAFAALPTVQERPIVLDAGCGAALSALEYFSPVLDRIRYLGADISPAVDVARDRMTAAGADGAFLQCDLSKIPLPSMSVDIIFSEGVLHHTDSTEKALKSLVPLLKPNGLFLFYVYNKKGPVREFTDDLIREKIRTLPPEQAWQSILSMTKFGKMIGDLNIDIDIPEAIDLLEIPAGKINLQRLFYYHVFKSFYRSDYTLDEMACVNFDWYAPRNAHRQTPEEVRSWCAEASLDILRERVEESGITIVARRRSQD